MTKTIEERFSNKYQIDNITNCWNWIGAKFPNGRGELGYKNEEGVWKYKYAYRVSYELYKGEIPENMSVCHTCDNPSCVNPDHLWLGTTKDNARDMVNKGRSTSGETNPMSKLKREDVIKIRQDNRIHRQIAQDWKVSRELISQIKRGVIWNFHE